MQLSIKMLQGPSEGQKNAVPVLPVPQKKENKEKKSRPIRDWTGQKFAKI